MGHTNGEWEYSPDSTDYVCREKYEGCFKGVIHGKEDKMALAVIINDCVNGEANAHLIVEAVNACIKLNPDNPLAVAQSITALYEALKSLLWDLRQRAIPNDLTEFEQALASAEGK